MMLRARFPLALAFAAGPPSAAQCPAEQLPGSPAPGDALGAVLARDGEHILVGAPEDDDRTLDPGAVHAFRAANRPAGSPTAC